MRNLNIIVFVPALLLACGVKIDGQDESSAATTADLTSGGGTDGVSSTPTTGSVPGPTSIPATATDPGDPPDDSGAGSTQVDTGDTEGEVGDPSASTGVEEGPCEVLCATELACGIEVNVGECVAACESELDELRGECLAVTEVELECFAGLACEVLAEALTGGGPHPCVGAQHDAELACGSESCNLGGGGDMMGTFCQLSIDCPNQPLLEMQCDTQTCTCTEDGVETGTCAADGVCQDLNSLGEFAPGCCGFPKTDLMVPLATRAEPGLRSAA